MGSSQHLTYLISHNSILALHLILKPNFTSYFSVTKFPPKTLQYLDVDLLSTMDSTLSASGYEGSRKHNKGGLNCVDHLNFFNLVPYQKFNFVFGNLYLDKV